MTLAEKLLNMQAYMAVPKSRWNKFGKFYYRSCEDILDAAKPYLDEYKCSLLISDSLEECGGRAHIKATVTLIDLESDQTITVSAVAAEATQQKGMDSAQISGSTSTYARKYALNGLFLLDESEADPDTREGDVEQEEDKGAKPYKRKNGDGNKAEKDAPMDYRKAVAAVLKKRGVDIKSLENWKENLPEECKDIQLGEQTKREEWQRIFECLTKEEDADR